MFRKRLRGLGARILACFEVGLAAILPGFGFGFGGIGFFFLQEAFSDCLVETDYICLRFIGYRNFESSTPEQLPSSNFSFNTAAISPLVLDSGSNDFNFSLVF